MPLMHPEFKLGDKAIHHLACTNMWRVTKVTKRVVDRLFATNDLDDFCARGYHIDPSPDGGLVSGTNLILIGRRQHAVVSWLWHLSDSRLSAERDFLNQVSTLLDGDRVLAELKLVETVDGFAWELKSVLGNFKEDVGNGRSLRKLSQLLARMRQPRLN